MSDGLICPDCGGVIGASEHAGVKVCHCAAERFRIDEKLAREAEAKVAAEAAAPAVVEKKCRVCHRNLSGHRRIKDHDGYICLACAKQEQEDKAAGLVSCAECSRKLKPAGLIDYHGMRICRRCFADHQDLSKFKAPPPKLDQHDKHEKKRMKVLLIITLVLGLISLLSYLGYLGS
jgi:hypothetical protein